VYIISEALQLQALIPLATEFVPSSPQIRKEPTPVESMSLPLSFGQSVLLVNF
jgi:hypothetical protein